MDHGGTFGAPGSRLSVWTFTIVKYGSLHMSLPTSEGAVPSISLTPFYTVCRMKYHYGWQSMPVSSV